MTDRSSEPQQNAQEQQQQEEDEQGSEIQLAIYNFEKVGKCYNLIKINYFVIIKFDKIKLYNLHNFEFCLLASQHLPRGHLRAWKRFAFYYLFDYDELCSISLSFTLPFRVPLRGEAGSQRVQSPEQWKTVSGHRLQCVAPQNGLSVS